jgi:hypothetical protein
VGNLSLSLLTNERTYLRTADEDDDNLMHNDVNGVNSSGYDHSTPSDTSHHRQGDSRLYSYTLEDLDHLVQYAAARSITVVPEIDMPAHTL